MEALESENAAKAREVQMAANKTIVSDADITSAGNITTETGISSNKSGSAPKKKGPKAKLTAKEKKERSVSFSLSRCLCYVDFKLNCDVFLSDQIETERIIACLPLEFRGSDPVCWIYVVQSVIRVINHNI